MWPKTRPSHEVKVYYSKAAELDLVAIGGYTVTQWGEAQWTEHRALLAATCEEIIPSNLGSGSTFSAQWKPLLSQLRYSLPNMQQMDVSNLERRLHVIVTGQSCISVTRTLADWVLGMGEHVRVEGPRELIQCVSERLARALRQLPLNQRPSRPTTYGVAPRAYAERGQSTSPVRFIQ
jgi:hypothetical protein